MKRTEKTKIKKVVKNITADFLEQMLNIGGNLFMVSISKKAAYQIFYDNYQTQTPDGFSKWLNNLRQSGYIRYDNESIEFTSKTKLKMSKIMSRFYPEINVYTFFSFDIPEIFNKHRDRFRFAIKNLGCKQVQKSLWVTNKDIYNLVQEYAYDCGVEKYLASIVSAKSDIDGVIDQMFISE